MIEIRSAGLLFKENKLLLAEHSKKNQNYWVLPGGRVEFGETLEEAVIREFKEETGFVVRPAQLVFFHEVILKKPARHIINFYFLVKKTGGIFRPQYDRVLKNFKYFKLAALPHLNFQPKKLMKTILGAAKNNFKEAPRFLGNLGE